MHDNILISGFELDEIKSSFEELKKNAKKLIVVADASYLNKYNSPVSDDDDISIEILDRFELRQGVKCNLHDNWELAYDCFSVLEYKILSDMFDRMYPHANVSNADKNSRLANIVQKAKQLVESVDVVLSREYPHFPLEYCILLFCKKLGVPHFSFNYCEYLSVYKICKNGNLTDIQKTTFKTTHSIESVKNNAFELLSSRIQFGQTPKGFMSYTFNNTSFFSAWLNFFLLCFTFILKQLVGYKSWVFFPSSNGKQYPLFHLISVLKITFNSVIQKRFFNKKSSCHIMDGNANYDIIYFANYQPESSTLPGAMGLHDTGPVVRYCLQQCAEYGLKLSYKEHPAIFNLSKRGLLYRGSTTRSVEIYQSILSAGVDFISLDKQTAPLLKNCKGVITMSGTVALEASYLGIPALVLGDVWFKEMKGVFGLHQKQQFFAACQNANHVRSAQENRVEIDKLFLKTLNHSFDEPSLAHFLDNLETLR